MNFDFVKHNVFGWVVHQKKLPAGTTYTVSSPEKLERIDTDNINIWSKGRVKTVSSLDGVVTELEDRVPGMFSLDRPALHGEYTMTALVDSEFWCINGTINRHKLPDVSAFILEKGEKQVLPKGTNLLICVGELIVNGQMFMDKMALTFSNKRTVEAQEKVIGLLFKEANV